MAEPQARPKRASKPELSVASVVGAVGGLALIVGFFSPLYEIRGGAGDDPVLEATQKLERALQAVRDGGSGGHPELEVFAPLVEPTSADAAAFLATSSPRNLAMLAGDARDLVAVVAVLEGNSDEPRVEEIRAALLGLMLALLSMPVVGAYHAVRAAVTKCRPHGSVGLALSFLAGLFYLGIGAACIVGVPERAREQLGAACWLLAAGGALLLFTGIFGVTRQTWWKAYLIDAVGLVALFYGVVMLANERL